LPISNLFPLNAQVAEHWIYMASAGLLVMLAGFACAIPGRYQGYLAVGLALAAAGLGLRTARRAGDWAEPEGFYRGTIAAGGFPERVSLNLAEVCTGKGKVKEAEAILRKTVADYPDYPAARIQLGMNLLNQGRNGEAEPYLKMNGHAADVLAASTPQSWHAALNLASMQYNGNEREAALGTLDGAIRRYPEVWELV
jgi:tetratricopeptide (TPR) repeat protein